MSSTYRSAVNKAKASKAFNHQVQRTKAVNLSPGHPRGGWRL